MSCDHEHGSMTCKEIFASLSEYLDGELDASLCEELEGHLGECPPCVRFLDSLRSTVAHLQSEPSAEMPEGLREAVCEAYTRFRAESDGSSPAT